MGNGVYVQLLPQREERLASPPVFLAQIKLAQATLQPGVTDIVGFALANHSQERLVDQAACGQGVRQYGQVFHLDGVLQGDAGSGDQDGAEGFAPVGTGAVKGYPRR